MKSGAVVVPEDAPEGTALLLVKGAPNVIKHMTRTGNIPENYDRVMARCYCVSRFVMRFASAYCQLCSYVLLLRHTEVWTRCCWGKPVSVNFQQCMPCHYMSSCMQQAPHLQQTVLI